MFDTIHHIAIIGSDYEKSKHFYVDLLRFKVIRENYRKERDDYKTDLACGPQEIELFHHKKCSSSCKLSGSIVDVSQLQYTLERAGGYGYRNVGFIRQTKRNVISTFFIVTERKAWNMRLLKQRLTEWPNAFISMKAQSMRSKAEVLPDTLT